MQHRARARYVERLTTVGGLEVVQYNRRLATTRRVSRCLSRWGFPTAVPRPKARQVTATDISAAIRFPLFLTLGTLNKA